MCSRTYLFIVYCRLTPKYALAYETAMGKNIMFNYILTNHSRAMKSMKLALNQSDLM